MKDLIERWLGGPHDEESSDPPESRRDRALREAAVILNAPEGEQPSRFSWRHRAGIRGAERRHVNRVKEG